jgi:hypothetical protein
MTETKTTTRNLAQLAKLRLIVGYLGEKKQCAWWDTGFLDTTGQRYLEMVFPRTKVAAGIRSTGEAARTAHDAKIGKVGTYHLFRLPVEIEDRIEQLFDKDQLSEWMKEVQSKDAALSMLDQLAQTKLDAPEGPVQVGTSKTILRKDSIAELAAHYHSAMNKGRMCYPYFAAQ